MYFRRMWIILQSVIAQSFPNFDDLKFLFRSKAFGVLLKPKHANKKVKANCIFKYFRHFISLTIVLHWNIIFIWYSIVKLTPILFLLGTLLKSVHSYRLKIIHLELISLISKRKCIFSHLSWFSLAQPGE